MIKYLLQVTTIVSAVSLLAVLGTAQSADPDILIAHEMRDKGNYDGAIALYTKLLEARKGEEKATIYALRGETYLERAKFHSLRGETDLYKNDLDRAFADSNSTLELDPGSAHAYFLRAQVYRRKKEFVRSLADLSRSIELDSSADSYTSRAMVNVEASNYDDALRDINKALETRPDSSPAIALRGWIYQRKGEFDKALQDFSKSIELNFYNSDTYLQRASLYQQMRRYDEAMADANKAIELSPRRADAYAVRGGIYRALGQYGPAIADLERALQLDRNARNVSYNLGHAYLATGRYDLAEVSFSNAIEQNPDFAGNYYSRAWAYLDMGNSAAAFKDAEYFISKNGAVADPGPYAVMVGYLALRKSNRADEAKAFLAKFIPSLPKDTWSTSILQYFNGSLSEDQLLAKATDNDKLTEAHAYIGELRLLAGDKQSAATHFKWVRDRGNKNFSEYGLAVADLTRIPH